MTVELRRQLAATRMRRSDQLMTTMTLLVETQTGHRCCAQADAADVLSSAKPQSVCPYDLRHHQPSSQTVNICRVTQSTEKQNIFF